MSEKKAPKDYWIRLKVESQWKGDWHSTPCVGTRNYWEDEHTIHVREVLAAPEISEEEIREAAIKEIHKMNWIVEGSQLEEDFENIFKAGCYWAIQRMKGELL